jgi:hypothetical protein
MATATPISIHISYGPNPTPAAMAAEKLSPEAGRAMEDYLINVINAWDEVRKATAYHYLHAQGMNLQKAYQIRVKAGLSD